MTTCALLLRHGGGQLRGGRPHHSWLTQRWTLPRALLTLEELPLGTSGRRPPRRLLMSTPSALCLVGLTTWLGTSLRLTWRQRSRNVWRTGTSIFVFEPKVATAHD
jgi:hypothetical protein